MIQDCHACRSIAWRTCAAAQLQQFSCTDDVGAVHACRSLAMPTRKGDTFSSGVFTDGNPYGVAEGLIFSMPCISKVRRCCSAYSLSHLARWCAVCIPRVASFCLCLLLNACRQCCRAMGTTRLRRISRSTCASSANLLPGCCLHVRATAIYGAAPQLLA